MLQCFLYISCRFGGMTLRFGSLLAVLLCLGLNQARAQQVFSLQSDSIYIPKSGIYFQPLELVTGSLRLGYEHRLRPDMSLLVLASFARSAGRSELYGLDDYSRTTMEAQCRYYPGSVALNGVYIGGYGYFRHLGLGIQTQARVNNSSVLPFIRGNAQAIGLGWMMGVQYLLVKHLTVDVYLGGGVKWVYFRGPSIKQIDDYTRIRDNSWDNYRNGVRINLGISFGFLLYD
jgi:hypothetical protein